MRDLPGTSTRCQAPAELCHSSFCLGNSCPVRGKAISLGDRFLMAFREVYILRREVDKDIQNLEEIYLFSGPFHC